MHCYIDPSRHPNHLSTQTMWLRWRFNYDEAFAKVVSVASQQNHQEYLGQSNNNRALHGGTVGFGLLGFILQDLLAIQQDGDYFVDIGSGCGLIPNTIGLYQPPATTVDIECNEFWSFIAAVTSMVLANLEPCICLFTTPIFTGKISGTRTSWQSIWTRRIWKCFSITLMDSSFLKTFSKCLNHWQVHIAILALRLLL